ncbi:unnamed protein product [Caenorhabditis bovis]|uniref:Bestrophin homolog n=1 Tax=Caenorhabditis bovis TaxID=2654633 RepID=A0A8S1EQA2_9PELO|nr:unnamed protein product [Caenorhabditis bovis]
MTVSYNSDVSSVSSTTFFKLLIRWKGSIWKSVSSELMLWTTFYVFTAFVYHLILYPNGSYHTFNKIAYYCNEAIQKYIPVTFMLGFFVTMVVERWRTTFSNMGWIENCALTVNAMISGETEEATLIRRNIVRYLVLSQILTFRDISMRVRRRFPNMDSIAKAGFLTIEEAEQIDEINLSYNKYWVPINWAISLCNKANKDGLVVSFPGHVAIVNEIKTFRTNLATICNFDWVPVPIAYPQVVFFAVRVYFCLCLFTRQFIRDEKKAEMDYVNLLVRPIITIIEFICLVGWMKVAEALLNPLGEDDDDFECNYLIDKNIFTGMKIVDEFNVSPPTIYDSFSDPDAVPIYSVDCQKHQNLGELVGSVSNVTLAKTDEDIPMVPVAPRMSIGDLHDGMGSRLSSVRRRFNSSRPSSIRVAQAKSLSRQTSVEGENNKAYEIEIDEKSESPVRPSQFHKTLSKVDEHEEYQDKPQEDTSPSNVISKV